MDKNTLERLTATVNAIPLGDDIAHVVTVLGPPDSDHADQKNEYHRFFTYFVTRQRADNPLDSDRVVLLAFNKAERLAAVYSNVQKIATRNWP